MSGITPAIPEAYGSVRTATGNPTQMSAAIRDYGYISLTGFSSDSD